MAINTRQSFLQSKSCANRPKKLNRLVAKDVMDYPGLFHDLALTNLANFVTPISKIVSRSTEVVPFGVTGASNNIRLNKHSRDITVFKYEIGSQLVGHLLGDGSILFFTRQQSCSLTPYFVITQTIK